MHYWSAAVHKYLSMYLVNRNGIATFTAEHHAPVVDGLPMLLQRGWPSPPRVPEQDGPTSCDHVLSEKCIKVAIKLSLLLLLDLCCERGWRRMLPSIGAGQGASACRACLLLSAEAPGSIYYQYVTIWRVFKIVCKYVNATCKFVTWVLHYSVLCNKKRNCSVLCFKYLTWMGGHC